MKQPLIILIISLFLTGNAHAGKLFVTAGAIHNTTDSQVSMGVPILGAKLNVDAENDLDLDENTFSPYIKFVYEIDNDHTLYVDWRTLHRKTQAMLESKPVEMFGNTYQATADIDFKLNLDIARIGYGYNFYETDSLRFDALIGLHVMNISGEGGVSATLSVDGKHALNIDKTLGKATTAPLPNVGIMATYQVLPGLSLRSHLQTFMISTRLYDGHLIDFNIGADYQLSDALSINASYSHYEIAVEYGDSLLNADISMAFNGPMLALTYQF